MYLNASEHLRTCLVVMMQFSQYQMILAAICISLNICKRSLNHLTRPLLYCKTSSTWGPWLNPALQHLIKLKYCCKQNVHSWKNVYLSLCRRFIPNLLAGLVSDSILTWSCQLSVGSIIQQFNIDVYNCTLRKKVLQSTFFGASGCHK